MSPSQALLEVKQLIASAKMAEHKRQDCYKYIELVLDALAKPSSPTSDALLTIGSLQSCVQEQLSAFSKCILAGLSKLPGLSPSSYAKAAAGPHSVNSELPKELEVMISTSKVDKSHAI
jgi:hypothetical protein